MMLLDDFLFHMVEEDKELFQILTSILIEHKLEFFERAQTEKILGISRVLREARLDVFNMDTDRHIYVIEMQNKKKKSAETKSAVSRRG